MGATDFIKNLLTVALGLVPIIGPNALSAVERAATVPEKDVRNMCHGMTEEQKVRAVELFRKAGDAISDATVYVASGGRVEPD